MAKICLLLITKRTVLKKIYFLRFEEILASINPRLGEGVVKSTFFAALDL